MLLLAGEYSVLFVSDQHLRATDHKFFLLFVVGIKWTNQFTTLIQRIVVLALMVTVVVGQPQMPEASLKMVPRLNYGVIFQQEHPMHLAREYWLHTYSLDIPHPVLGNQMPRCRHGHMSCHILNTVTLQIASLRSKTLVNVNASLERILNLIPQSSIVNERRYQRSLLPFIGDMVSGLFGTATMDDVNTLARHINALVTRTNIITKAVKQHGSHLSSFMKVVDDRMTNLKNGIENNFKTLNNVLHNFRFTYEHLELTLTNISGILADQVHRANELELTFLSLQSSVQSLVEGKLTPFLLPKQVIAQTMSEIQSILHNKYSGFHLIVADPVELYRNAQFFYARKAMQLYITVKFPIASRANALNLYRIISLPVPVNNTSQHATQLLDLPDYLAVTYHQQFYANIPNTKLMTCKHDNSYLCDFNIPLTPVRVPSCVWSVFTNDKVQIYKNCNFRFRQSLLKPTVLEITASSVLIYNTPKVSVNCPQNQYTIPGCSFCIHSIPCMCTVSSDTWFYSPRLIRCVNGTDEKITPLYPVNLALLQEFFNDSNTKSIAGDTTFSLPTSISIPQFKLYNHSFTKILAADEKAHLSLRKMADATKRDQVVFETLTEPLLEGEINVKDSWPHLSDILTILAMGVGSLALLGVAWLFVKLRSLAAALFLLQQVSRSKSMTPPIFQYELPSTPAPESDTISLAIFEEFSWIHASLVLNVFTVFILLGIVSMLWKRKPNGTFLYLELTNSTNCTLIPIMHLPLCPSYWDIHHPRDISDLSLAPLPSCKLLADWPGFKVTNKLTRNSISVATTVNLNIWQYFAVKKLLQQPFCAHLLIGHQGLFQPLCPKETKILDKINNKMAKESSMYPSLNDCGSKL